MSERKRPPKIDSFVKPFDADRFLDMFERDTFVTVEARSRDGTQKEILDVRIDRVFGRDGRVGLLLNAILIKGFLYGWDVSVRISGADSILQHAAANANAIKEIRQITEDWLEFGEDESIAMEKIADILIRLESKDD